MSGIGKTTIAKFVYNSNFRRFEGSSFLENIKEISEQPNGLVQIQMQLLSNILNGRKVMIHSVSEGITKIADTINSKRVLLVLDDVDHLDQLDAVLRMHGQFYPGSKIIITTRHLRLLKAQQVTKVHNVETLDYKESLELFSWHAFRQDLPIEGYMKLSEKVVHQSGGLPLALKVLGSSLFGESLTVWESALQKLEAIPNSEIMNKLKISYESLQDDHDRKLFLHIACFFIGNDRYNIVRLLDECNLYTTVGIQNLVDRGLVTIDGYDKVKMHNVIRDTGRGIVRQESEDPEKRSRLWHYKDSIKVLTEKNGTENIEGLVLNRHMYPANTPSVNPNETILETNAFARMCKLRLLHLSNVQLNGCYKELPSKLRWLCWHAFPLDCIPTDFPMANLVVLKMHNSSLTQIWKGTKYLPSLKVLDLSYSHGLTETASFSPCPNLEKLVLVDCASLINVHESIGSLERLVYLNMKNCKNIRMLPKNICMLKLLETLIISGCSNLNMFPMEMKNMESLKVLETNEIPINQLRSTGGDINSSLGRSICIFWTCLPHSLVELSLSGCNLLDDAFPGNFGNLSSLKRLDLQDNPICSLPNCVRDMKRLDKLSFCFCKRLKSLLGLPKVDELYVYACHSLEKITYQSSLCKANNVFGQMCSLVENEYMYKLEPIGSVDVEMINVLGLCNLEPMRTVQLMQPQASDHYLCPIQGLHEGGIFSTFLSGNEVPGLSSHKSTESSISFVVPLVPNVKIRGLNIFVVYENLVSETPYGVNYSDYDALIPIVIKVRNRTKALEWIYCPSFYGIPSEGEEMVWLSHWKLENQLEGGDEMTVTVFILPWRQVKQCGIHVVHEKEENMSLRRIRDPCYPYVIGGDLSGSEVMPGTYFLSSLAKPLIYKPQLHEFIGDSDTEKEVQLMLAPTGGSSNCDFRGWKGLIIAAGFFLSLSLSLFARFPLPRRKKHSA